MRNPGVEMGKLYEEYYSKVYNHIFYRLLHKEQTEDLVSQVFLKIFQSLDCYNPQKAAMGTWIYRITENTLIDYYRSRKLPRSWDHEGSAWQESVAVSFEEQYEKISNPKRRALYRALSKLSDRERQLIYLKYFEEYSNRKIAKLLHMNASTVGTILMRSRSKLKDIIKEDKFL